MPEKDKNEAKTGQNDKPAEEKKPIPTNQIVETKHTVVIGGQEIIGEAARRVSSETKKKHPNLPRREMTGMRNLVIHEYDAVDLSIVWDTVHKKLPALVAELEKIVPAENG